MSDIAKTIEKLKKLHQKYTEDVQMLSGKSAGIAALLAEAREKAIQTADAIAALEGRPALTKLLQDALTAPKPDRVFKIPDSPDTRHAVAEIPQSGNLPPAELGMQWTKNADGEDVLVPLVLPVPRAMQGVIQTDIHLPPVAEDATFEDPTSFLT